MRGLDAGLVGGGVAGTDLGQVGGLERGQGLGVRLGLGGVDQELASLDHIVGMAAAPAGGGGQLAGLGQDLGVGGRVGRRRVELPHLDHRLGIAGAVDQADLVQLQAGDPLGVALVAGGDPAADGEALVDAQLDLADSHGVDHVGLDAGEALAVHVGGQGGAGGGHAVHLAQGAEAHVVGQGRLHGRGIDPLLSGIDGAAGGDADHLEGAVVLGFELGDLAIDAHAVRASGCGVGC